MANSSGDQGATLQWSVPEFACTALLVATGFLILGGLATGIVMSTGVSGPSTTQVVGSELILATEWANPVMAVALLAVVGICWWRLGSGDVSGTRSAGVAGMDEPTANLFRMQAVGQWVQIELVLLALAAAADFIGQILVFRTPGSVQTAYLWGRDIFAGASMLASWTIAAAGLLIVRDVES